MLYAGLIFDPEDGIVRSCETSIHKRTTPRYIPEDGNIDGTAFHIRTKQTPLYVLLTFH
jgi:hypothetical protein